MLSELATLYQSAERRKSEMLALIEPLSEEERNINPSPTEWSPLQVLEHVVTVEEWVAAPLCPEDDKILLKGHLFMAFGVGAMRLCFRMPTLPQAIPGGTLDFAAIERRWNEARNTLLSKLEGITSKTEPIPISPHPIAGPLNAKQTLELLDAHLNYHLHYFPQIKKGNQP